MNSNLLTVVIPAFNEGDIIYRTVTAVKKVPLVNQVIVVDDGSFDNTPLEAKRAGANLIRLTKNRGKGYALFTGYKSAHEKIIAFIDADLGETAYELGVLVEPVINNDADIAIASFKRENSSGGLGLVRLFASISVAILGGNYITSPLSGQRVMRKETADTLFPLEQDFGIEIDGTIKALKNGLKIKEVHIDMTHRKTKRDVAGFIHRLIQGWQIFKAILFKYLMKRTKKTHVAYKRRN